MNEILSLSLAGPTILIKLFLMLFLVFYGVFAAILYKQILAMDRKMVTSFAPVLRFLGLVNFGLAFGLLFIAFGAF